jgi:hypothetical protein
MMVIGSFASYTKTKSVESVVRCLLTLDDDDVEQVVVNRYWVLLVQRVLERVLERDGNTLCSNLELAGSDVVDDVDEDE